MFSSAAHDRSDTHQEQYRAYSRLLRRWRKRLWIPPRWSFHLQVECPEDMPHAQGLCSWHYLPNAQFRIALACNLSDELAEWVIAHELLEALTANYAQLYEQTLTCLEREEMPAQVLDVLREQHGDVRNEMIEWLLRVLLKRERPEAWERLSA